MAATGNNDRRDAMDSVQTIPARSGKAIRLSKGERIRIINTHGEQVVDTWAFNANDSAEFMAMDATRAFCLRLCPVAGEPFMTNRRRPILLLEDDSCPGSHDTLMAACDRWRYHLLGYDGIHDNCADNLSASLAELGMEANHTPSPLNLFMNIPWKLDGSLSFDPPVTRAGDSVTFRAEMDCVVAMSACPQDILPVNGKSCQPTEAHFEIL